MDREQKLKELNKWFNENKKMFEDSLFLSDNYKLWWSYIPHFIHSPFYCYAYSYGQLLSLTLFGLYKSGSKDFVEKYTEFCVNDSEDVNNTDIENLNLYLNMKFPNKTTNTSFT